MLMIKERFDIFSEERDSGEDDDDAGERDPASETGDSSSRAGTGRRKSVTGMYIRRKKSGCMQTTSESKERQSSLELHVEQAEAHSDELQTSLEHSRLQVEALEAERREQQELIGSLRLTMEEVGNVI